MVSPFEKSQLNHEDIDSLSSSLKTIQSTQKPFASGRKYLEIQPFSLVPGVTDQEKKKASLNEVESLVGQLSELDVAPSDVGEFNEMMILFKKVVLKEHPKNKEKIEALFGGVQRTKKETSVKDTPFYSFVASTDSKNLKSAVEKGQQLGLTESEAISIFLYSKQTYLLLNSLARGQIDVYEDEVENFLEQAKEIRALQKLMEKEKKALAEDLRSDLQLIKSEMEKGMSKMPPYKGSIYRGDLLTNKELKKMESGVYSDPTIMSFSASSDEAMEFAYRSPTNAEESHHAFIQVLSKSAKDISALSGEKYEQEVSYPPNTKFDVIELKKKQVINKSNETFDLYEITLKERG